MSPSNLPVRSFLFAVPERLRSVLSRPLGITVMESIIALTLFSSAGTAVLLGVSAAHTSGDRVDASAVAENLSRNQMEYVMSQPFTPAPGTYTSIADVPGLGIPIPNGFSVTAAAQTYGVDDGLSGNIQKVVVTVTRGGQSILELTSLRSGP